MSKKLLFFHRSLVNSVKLNKIFERKNLKKKIFFYFPKKNLTIKDIKYIEHLFQNLKKRYEVFFGHNIYNLKRNKFFFITENYVSKLKNLDFFISNYICYNFPNNAKKVYLHHGIYDTPLTGKLIEKKTFKSILNYDYIFLPSKIIINNFIKYFKVSNKIKAKFLSAGYPRLDYLQNLRKNKLKKNSIIIAFANISAFTDHSILNFILPLVERINSKFKYKIIIRPHPANKNYFNRKNLPILFDYMDKNKNTKLDFSDNYINSYFKSILMITDISGTSYTYSFLTGSPVIFFSKNEKKYKKQYSKLNFFKDRGVIGKVITQVSEIEKTIKFLILNRSKITKKIYALKSKRLDYVGSSHKRFGELIEKI